MHQNQANVFSPNLVANSNLDISIVIPVFNEEKSLPELHQKITSTLTKITDKYEIIFVDDGSSDNSFLEVLELQKQDSKVNSIKLRKNFGKAVALSFGFQKASGEKVITMDADLQDEPTEIPKLLKKLDEGFDLVSGWKERRQDPISKTLPSKVFNLVVSKLSGVKLNDFNCGFKIYKKIVVKNLNLYGEMHRFVPVLASFYGFKIAEVSVKHNKRKHGYSKYGLLRFFRGFFDAITVFFITKYLSKPLHFFGMIGLISLILGTILGSYLTLLKLFGSSIGTRPLLSLAVLLIILGVQFISTGLVAEMIRFNYAKKDSLPDAFVENSLN